jgi:hypothetical protein
LIRRRPRLYDLYEPAAIGAAANLKRPFMNNLVVVADSEDSSRFSIITESAIAEKTAEIKALYPLGKNAREFAAIELAGFEAPREASRYDVLPLADYLAMQRNIAAQNADDGGIVAYTAAHIRTYVASAPITALQSVRGGGG